jgi:hypothetical protein
MALISSFSFPFLHSSCNAIHFKCNIQGLSFYPSARPAGSSEDGVGPDGKPVAHKSFFIRYWYIILPMVLVGMFSGGEEPAPAAGGGGAVSAQPASGGGAQRRGKRD